MLTGKSEDRLASREFWIISLTTDEPGPGKRINSPIISTSIDAVVVRRK
jgi:hypothetical protein